MWLPFVLIKCYMTLLSIQLVYECKHRGFKAEITAKLSQRKKYFPLCSHMAMVELLYHRTQWICPLDAAFWCITDVDVIALCHRWNVSCWKVSSTSFRIYKLHKFWLMCLSVCQCIGLLDTIYQYLYHYIIFWYIYECILTNGGATCILLGM